MTKEEVQEYIDNYISHIISMVEYGNWFADEINQLVEEVREKIDVVFEQHIRCNTKKACREMFNEIDELLKLFEIEVSNFIDNELSKVIIEEDEWLDEYVAEPLGVTLDKSRKAIELLKMLPIASAGVIGIYGHTLADRLNTLYRQKINQSYVTGSSFEELEDMYEARFNTFERGLQSEGETIGESLGTQYERIVFSKNAKQIKGYVWQSVLDGRTCVVCGSLSGMKFTNLSKVPMYPCHNGCRCFLLPYTEDIEDSLPQSYEEWFEKQPKKEKYKILGKTRFQLYENGMKIKNFVNNGKKTPLKDLQK